MAVVHMRGRHSKAFLSADAAGGIGNADGCDMVEDGNNRCIALVPTVDGRKARSTLLPSSRAALRKASL
jgi:hypothetical protein